MLVLSRRLNQKIVLPGLGVTIAVVAVRGNAVRLGIQAPPQVPLAREEVLAHVHDPAPQARLVS
jgi:carbon storage regulator